MIRILLIVALTAPLGLALTLEEAVARALELNFGLKQKEALTRAGEENYDGSYSGYKPTLDLSYSYSKSNKTNAFIGSDTTTTASAVLGYNLFNGFADKYGIESARFARDRAAYERDAARADLVLQVNLDYIAYLRAEREIEIAKESIILLNKQLDDAKSFYEQGIFAKNDYLQVEVELATSQQDLLSAQRNVRIAFERLKRLLAGRLEKSETVEPVHREVADVNLSALTDTMFERRSELKSLKAQHAELDAQRMGAYSGYHPKVDANVKYQKAGDEIWPDGGKTFNTNDETSVNVAVAWNLYEGSATQRRAASLLEQTSALSFATKELELQLKLQLEEAVEAYYLARSKLSVAEKGLAQAKENYRITKNQFAANIADTTVFLEASRFLTRSQVEYYKAYFEIYDAMAAIERVVEAPLFN
jgi:outer membrane protein